MNRIFSLIIVLAVSIPLFADNTDWHEPGEYEKKLQIDFSIIGAAPIGKFNDIYQYGYGILIDTSYAPGFRQYFRPFVRTGFIWFEPETETDEGFDTGIKPGWIIPVLGGCEFRYTFFNTFRLAPSVTAGISVNRAVYADRSGTISGGVPTGSAAEEDKGVLSVEPFAGAGLGVYYILDIYDSIFLKTEIASIIEFDGISPDSPMNFIIAAIGYEKRI